MNQKRKIIAAVILFILGVGLVATSYLIQQGTLTVGSKASSNGIAIVFNSTEQFGEVNQSLGIIIPDATNQAVVQDAITSFGGKQMYVKINAPSQDIIRLQTFNQLLQAGFKPYLTLADYSQMDAVLQQLSLSYTNETVIELADITKLDAAATQTLLTSYPFVKFHAAQLAIWPRDRVVEILGKVQPPTLDAVSFTMEVLDGEDVFGDVYLAFMTIFDAAKDVAGNSGININYPEGSALSLSNINIPATTSQNQARIYGEISSTIVASVQAQAEDEGTAPIRYVIAGDITTMTPQHKIILQKYAEFMNAKPQIVWPYAIPQNGDPWYNPFISESNTKPIIGVIGYKNNGFMGIMYNASGDVVTGDLPGDISFAGYQGYSNVRGVGNPITDGSITFQPYETVVFYSAGFISDSPIPTAPQGSPTIQPTSNPNATPTVVPSGQPTTNPSVGPSPTGVAIPTTTGAPSLTTAPTITPTRIPSPTPTAVPTATVVPSSTPTATPLPTATSVPTPTFTPTLTQIPATATPPTVLTVNDQPPGLTPWVFILIPFGFILLGLVL
ncbi:MAG: hypothetical protein ACEQSA_04820 [Weeksellaceae bacterium]